MRETALIPWIITEPDGRVLASHCTCMEGIGETCTHVAAVLFAIDGTVKVWDSRTVTQEPAYWLLPSSVKGVSYNETRNIDFSSAKTMKKRFDSNCNSAMGNALTKSNSTTKKRQIPEPTDQEMNTVFSNLAATGRKPAILSLIEGFSDSYVPKVMSEKLPKPLTELAEKDALHLNFKDLLEKCSDMQLQITAEEIKNVETTTKMQAKDKRWYSYQVGREGNCLKHEGSLLNRC